MANEIDWKAVTPAMLALCDAVFNAALECIEFVIEQREKVGHVPPKAFQYPALGKFDSGLPHCWHEYDRGKVPTDYEGYLTDGYGLLRLPLSGVPKEKIGSLSKVNEALNALNDVSNVQINHDEDDKDFDFDSRRIVQTVVCRYLSKYQRIEKNRLDDVIWRVIERYSGVDLKLILAVPIVLTHFDFKHFSLDANHKIVRIPDDFQKARSLLFSTGAGVESTVAGAATHAFIATNWSITPDSAFGLNAALTSFPVEAADVVERFFASLRLATGVDTGYSQVLYVHRKWDYYPKWDLPSLSGKYFRRYPSHFDNYGWIRTDLPRVSLDQMMRVREYFKSLEKPNNSKIVYALRRLSSALSRDDDDDGILDATIGLELLLGDESEALSYKLRLRAAALAKLSGAPLAPEDVMRNIKNIYNVRSKIVHSGVNPKKIDGVHQLSDQRVEPSKERREAIELLRFAIDTLMRNPEYNDPRKIDLAILS